MKLPNAILPICQPKAQRYPVQQGFLVLLPPCSWLLPCWKYQTTAATAMTKMFKDTMNAMSQRPKNMLKYQAISVKVSHSTEDHG